MGLISRSISKIHKSSDIPFRLLYTGSLVVPCPIESAICGAVINIWLLHNTRKFLFLTDIYAYEYKLKEVIGKFKFSARVFGHKVNYAVDRLNFKECCIIRMMVIILNPSRYNMDSTFFI